MVDVQSSVQPEAEKVRKRSPSQAGDYERCPHMYWLKRIEKVPGRPAAWLPQGTAVHAAIEAFERSVRTMPLEDAQDVFRDEYSRESGVFTAYWPNFDTWSWSGPYSPQDDVKRRYDIGLEQVSAYYKWIEKNPQYHVYVIGKNGERAIELDLHGFFGRVPVNGKADLVYYNSELRALRVIDVKTGKKPGDSFQLGTYAELIRQQYQEDINTGYYWMAQTGKLTRSPYDLTEWSYEALTEVYETLDDNIRAGDFPALPDPSKCFSCSVNHACKFAEIG